MSGRPVDPGRAREGRAGGRGLSAAMTVRRGDLDLDVELAIDPGTTLALLGPNGAGKSTIVEVIAGLTSLAGGRLALGDQVLDHPAAGVFVHPDERRIGIVFQDHLLFPHLSVLDNIAFPIRHRLGLGRAAARQAAAGLLETFDLTALAGSGPDELSGGQANRVALARALAGEPDLLVLDEPFAAADVETRSWLRAQLADHLGRFAGPRLLITHDPVEAFGLADRLAVIEAGRLVQSGPTEEVRRHPATPWVAALTGTNLLSGSADEGRLTIEGTDVGLTAATGLAGPVQAIIDPRAVSLHRHRPEGSPRNTWSTVVEWTEPLGLTTRVRLGAPLPLTVDITPASAEALGLGPGRPVWAAVKATEIVVRRIGSTTDP